MDFKKLRDIQENSPVNNSVDNSVNNSVDKDVLKNVGKDLGKSVESIEKNTSDETTTIRKSRFQEEGIPVDFNSPEYYNKRDEFHRARARAGRSNNTTLKKDGKKFYNLDTTYGERKGIKEFLVDADGAIRDFDDENFEVLDNLNKVVGKTFETDESIIETSDTAFVGNSSIPEGQVFYPWSRTYETQTKELSGKFLKDELDIFQNFNKNRSWNNLKESYSAYGKVKQKNLKMILGKYPALNNTDMDLIIFLVKFRFVSVNSVSNALGVTVATAKKRLKKLADYGLVINVNVLGDNKLWVATKEAGELVKENIGDGGLIVQNANDISIALLQHQYLVNHIASCLWSGCLDVLYLKDFPKKNRLSFSQKMVFGEDLVCETEIRRSYTKLFTDFGKTTFERGTMNKRVNEEFEQWNPEETLSPEQIHGNEYLFALFPPTILKLKFHFPDLVIRRPRKADGSPANIAIEAELKRGTGKQAQEVYERTLLSYKSDHNVYEKVIWVTDNAKNAKLLENAAKNTGLLEEGRFDVVPIITNEGLLKDRKIWTL